MHDVKKLSWDEAYLFCICIDQIIRCCVTKVDMMSIIEACDSSPFCGHHSGIHIIHQILHCWYSCLTIHKDYYDFAKSYDHCQRERGMSKR